MAASKRRRSDRALRPPMGSPGRPPLGRREHRQRFWEEVARGLSSEESAVAAGVSPAVGARWFRQCGGMPPFSLRPLSGRYLSFVEREEIAVLQARGCGVREIARQLRRSSSTISRELRGTLVERTSRFTMRLHLPRLHRHDEPRTKNGPALAGHGAEAVRDAIASSITTLPEQLRRSLTWDQGAEMAQHAQLRIDTGLAVYFCDPQSPWQRGTNENTNGLLRQYFPK